MHRSPRALARRTTPERLRESVRRASALALSEQPRFVRRDVMRRPGRYPYRLKTGDQVMLRHDNREDTFVLEEVFGTLDHYRIPESIRDVRRVADLGANIGLTALKLLRAFPDATLTAVEPDAGNLPLLRACLEANGLADRAEVLPVAASNLEGTLRFAAGYAGRSHAASSDEEATVVPMIDVLPMLQDVDVLKMDIEGGEWPILTDDRFNATPVKVLYLEYHSLHAPSEDPSGLVRGILNRGGFTIHDHRYVGAAAVLRATR